MGLKFDVNLSMLFQEVPFLDRFTRARDAGFKAVEYLFPYQEDIKAIRARLDGLGLEQVLFNLHPGQAHKEKIALGEWGTASNPARRDYFRWSLTEALEIAQFLCCTRLNMMIGQRVEEISPQEQFDCTVENLNWALPLAKDAGVTLMIEPLNDHDFPHYWIVKTEQAMEIINLLNHPNLKLQYDFYHAQIMEGNLEETVRKYIGIIGHIQIADVPGRHEPGSGEIDFRTLFKTLEELGYEGYIGLEYRPSAGSEESLAWLMEYR